jgi:hypothetical protein
VRHLRLAVGRLPRHTREAMLRGIDSNRIIVGAYVDPASGGVCPMLAAHRNGGRTSVASFARAWDQYTAARRPRRATRREVRVLRGLLEDSLAGDDSLEGVSIAELAAQIRAERAQLAACRPEQPETTEPELDGTPADDLADAERLSNAIRIRSSEAIRIRRRTRRQPGKDILAAADEQLREPA